MLEAFITQLRQSASLTAEQVQEAVSALIDEAIAPELKADFLSALADKGESTEEIAGFARLLRDKSIPLHLGAPGQSPAMIDVCGTGGDHLNTFNISTAVAFIVAAAGVAVAKHGNRAVTSRSGSADLLEALEIRIDLKPEQAVRMLQEHQFAFFFAPHYHPAFKHIGPARKICAARGQRTIFNFLGPLLNPARPSAQLLGVSHPNLCESLARVLQSLGLRRALVVSGTVPAPAADHPSYLDEVSSLGPTFIAEFSQKHGVHSSLLSLETFPLQPADLAQLQGGDAKTNAGMIRRLFSGQDRGPKRDVVLLNAGAALLVAGVASDLREGWDRAVALLDSGQVAAKLEEIVQASASL